MLQTLKYLAAGALISCFVTTPAKAISTSTDCYKVLLAEWDVNARPLKEWQTLVQEVADNPSVQGIATLLKGAAPQNGDLSGERVEILVDRFSVQTPDSALYLSLFVPNSFDDTEGVYTSQVHFTLREPRSIALPFKEEIGRDKVEKFSIVVWDSSFKNNVLRLLIRRNESERASESKWSDPAGSRFQELKLFFDNSGNVEALEIANGDELLPLYNAYWTRHRVEFKTPRRPAWPRWRNGDLKR